MDIFTPDIVFDSQKESIHGNGALVKTNTPDTTLGSTVNYVYDANGVPRTLQQQDLATNLGLGAVAPYEGGIAVGAYANSLAIGCTAVGYHSQAKVNSATALGDQAQALAYRAIALGKNSNATGINSVAVGTLANASAANTVVIGSTATSTNIESVIIGHGAHSTYPDVVVIGHDATASGDQGVAVGQAANAFTSGVAVGLSAFAAGDSSIAIGFGSLAGNTNGIAIGPQAFSGPSPSIAIGASSQTTAANQVVIGSPTFAMSDIWFGRGNSINAQGGSTQSATTIHGEEWGGGSNKASGSLVLAGGRSTGTGIGGEVRLQVSDSSASGSTINTLRDRFISAPRKSLVNNTTTELVRFDMPLGSALGYTIKIGLTITDGTNVIGYSTFAEVAMTHDGAGYLSTITPSGAAEQHGGGGSVLAVTLSITQPAADIMAFNIKSNTTVITPSSTLCFINLDVLGETTVTLV